jgi:hypothetical protein
MIWDFTTYAQRELYKFATCIFFTRSKDERVEIYVDEIATAAFEARRRLICRFGLKPKIVPDPYDLIVVLIAGAVVHEWLHHEAHLEERAARFASEQLYEALLEPAPVASVHGLASRTETPNRLSATGVSRLEAISARFPSPETAADPAIQ